MWRWHSRAVAVTMLILAAVCLTTLAVGAGDKPAGRSPAGWLPNVRADDDPADEAKFYPRLDIEIYSTGVSTETHFLAVWQDNRNGTGDPDVYFSKSANTGQTWSPNVLVTDACTGDCPRQHTPDIALRPSDGSYWVVWQEDSGVDAGNILYSTSADRGSTWSPSQAVHDGVGEQKWPRIASHVVSGDLYVTWQDEAFDEGDIYIARYTSGPAWSAAVKVSDDVTGADQYNHNLAVDEAGNVFVVWQDARDDPDDERHIYFSRWLSGEPWGTWSTNQRINSDTVQSAFEPDIAVAADGTLYVTWIEQISTGADSYDEQVVVARSSNQGDSWAVSAVRRFSNMTLQLQYGAPTVVPDTLDRVYVIWIQNPFWITPIFTDSDVLFASSYDGGRTWFGSITLSQPAGTVDDFSIPSAVTVNGEMVVAWQDYRDGSKPHIYATSAFVPESLSHAFMPLVIRQR